MPNKSTSKKGGAKSPSGKKKSQQKKSLSWLHRQKRPLYTWGESEYTVRKLSSREIGELSKEYSRIRSILRKRYERLVKNDIRKVPDAFQAWVDLGGLEITSELAKDKRRLVNLLHMASKLLSMETTKIKGANEKIEKFVEHMQDLGYEFVTVTNALDFNNFMKEARIAGIFRLYDSDKVVEFYEEEIGVKNKVASEDLKTVFEKWLTGQNKEDRFRSKYSSKRKRSSSSMSLD